MLAGLVAGLLAAAFAVLFGEPSIERAIAFEAAIEQASGHSEAPELVGRAVQSRHGLLTAGAIHGAAIGGFFGLAFAFACGRLESLGPHGTAAALAVVGFVAIALVPSLKYPANPPAVGAPETIGARTALYFAFVLVSVCAMSLAAVARGPLRTRFGSGGGSLASLVIFMVLVIAAGRVMPAAEDAPAAFPSDLIATFRWASLATQAVLWAVLGLGFALVLPRRSA
jgi:predicted cobalt transporter CbtA